MAAATAPSSGLDLFDRVYYHPENFSKEGVLPKPLSVCMSVLSGIMKTLFFPILSAISTLGFFIKGCVEAAKGNENMMIYSFEASLISLAGFLASGAFFVLAAYTMPIIVSSHLILAAITLSVAVHVYRATAELPDKHVAIAASAATDPV